MERAERAIRVLCWSERTEPEAVYPQGINGAIAAALEEAGGFEARTASLADAGQGRVFYVQPGHEAYPVYFQSEVKRIMANACRWAAARTADVGSGSWWQRSDG